MGLPSLSKRWFTAVAQSQRSLAKPAVIASLRLSWFLERNVPESIQAPSPQSWMRISFLRRVRALSVRMRVVYGVIAAAGRSGIEEVYGVPYLDVGCDVCFHVA
jgi:hypothetical protein